MKENIEINSELLKAAMRITKIKSKSKLVNYALQKYLASSKRSAVSGMQILNDKRNKKESGNTIFIKSELSEEEKYRKRLQLLSLQGKVRMFD